MEKKQKLVIGAAIAAVIVITIIIVAIVPGNKGYRIISVENYEGEVAVLRDNSSINAVQGMNLVSEDFLNTATDSLATLLIDADKHIVVSPETEIEIVAVGNEKKGKVNVELKKGYASFAVAHKLSRGSTFEVETPNAHLSIRGTQFDVIYDDKFNTTNVNVLDGEVHVEAGNSTIDLSAGEQAIISGDEIIEANYIYDVEFYINFDISDPDYINKFTVEDITFLKFPVPNERRIPDEEYHFSGGSVNASINLADGSRESIDADPSYLQQLNDAIYEFYGEDYIKKLASDICDGVVEPRGSFSEYEVPRRITIYDENGDPFIVNVLYANRGCVDYYSTGSQDTIYSPLIKVDDSELYFRTIVFSITIDAASAEKMIELMKKDGNSTIDLSAGEQAIISGDEIIEANYIYDVEYFINFDIYDPDYINKFTVDDISLLKFPVPNERHRPDEEYHFYDGFASAGINHYDGSRETFDVDPSYLQQLSDAIYDFYGEDYIKKLASDICDGVVEPRGDFSESEVPRSITIYDENGEPFIVNVLNGNRRCVDYQTGSQGTIYSPLIKDDYEFYFQTIGFTFYIDAASAERMFELMKKDGNSN